MLIEKNGIKIDATVINNSLKYRVLAQDQKATDAIKLRGVLTDPQTGLTLRTNLKPAFNHKKRRFFLRGYEKEHDNREVVATFDSNYDANNAFDALVRLLEQAVLPEAEKTEHKKIGKPKPGSTTHCRMAIISKSQADHLALTAHDFYPESRTWEGGIKPIFTINPHYNEHIGQIVDILNKSVDNTSNTDKKNIVNPHKVTSEQAKTCVDAFRGLFDRAEQEGWLVACWRMASGLRGPDFVENPSTISQKQMLDCYSSVEKDIEKSYPGAKISDWSLTLDGLFVKIVAKINHNGNTLNIENIFHLNA